MKIIKETDIKSANYGSYSIQTLLDSNKYLRFSKLIISSELKSRVDKKFNNYFYVLSGQGTFVVGDKSIKVYSDNLVFVPQGISYSVSGSLTLLKISNE